MRLALMGAGRWAKNYISSIAQNEALELTSICTFGRSNIGIGSPAHLYTEWEMLLASEELDGVIVATTPSVQLEIALSLAKLRVPMILEKPIALNNQGLDDLSSAFRKYESKVLVNHFHLFHPAFRQLCSTIDSQEIQQIDIVDGSLGPFRKDMSSLYDWGPHAVGVALRLMGSFPTSIKAIRSKGVHSGDVWKVELVFENSIVVNILCGNGLPQKRREIEIFLKGRSQSLMFDLSAVGNPNTVSTGTDPEVDHRSPMNVLLEEFSTTAKLPTLSSSLSLDIALDAVRVLNHISGERS
ncbi:Gfo/Idh/MocA family oxidoreductase [Porticoccaceae bacterium]|nr:Gfo/Idh/MocA family oxidoreductase [Porticoccaceae bacterium]